MYNEQQQPAYTNWNKLEALKKEPVLQQALQEVANFLELSIDNLYLLDHWLLIRFESFILEYPIQDLLAESSANKEELRKRIKLLLDNEQQIHNEYLKKNDSFVALIQQTPPQLYMLQYLALKPYVLEHATVNARYELWLFMYKIDVHYAKALMKDWKHMSDAVGAKQRVAEYFETIENGALVVYSHDQQATQWSTNEQHAVKWATMEEQKQYTLVKGRVGQPAVYDILQQNGDEVVLIVPAENVELEQLTQVSNTLGLMQEYQTEVADIVNTVKVTYRDIYQAYRDQLKETWFECIEIHGVQHTKRVMLHAVMLCRLRKMSLADMVIVIVAAMYHDIGRTNDLDDDHHGQAAVKKMGRLKLPYHVKDPALKRVVNFLISTHCVGDEKAYEYLKKTSFKDKERVKHMYQVLCDADALDRVRTDDLDANYLRLPESKLMYRFALDVYKQLK